METLQAKVIHQAMRQVKHLTHASNHEYYRAGLEEVYDNFSGTLNAAQLVAEWREQRPF